jgi:hypothetical protein
MEQDEEEKDRSKNYSWEELSLGRRGCKSGQSLYTKSAVSLIGDKEGNHVILWLILQLDGVFFEYTCNFQIS